jgi:hypothetical protein
LALRTISPSRHTPPAVLPSVAPEQEVLRVQAADAMENLVRGFKAVGGGVTFNIGIFQEGVLGPATIVRLAELAKRVR